MSAADDAALTAAVTGISTAITALNTDQGTFATDFAAAVAAGTIAWAAGADPAVMILTGIAAGVVLAVVRENARPQQSGSAHALLSLLWQIGAL